MQEENLDKKNEKQVSTVYSLNSKLELVPEEVIEIKVDKEVIGAKNASRFYWGLLILDILVFIFILILAEGSDAGIGKMKDMVASAVIIEIIFSSIIIIFYKIL
jgi:hypothetical protein